MEAVHESRISRVTEGCREFVRSHDVSPALYNTGQPVQPVLVNNKHRFLFCTVLKVSSTNWKRAFMSLEGTGLPDNQIWRKKLNFSDFYKLSLIAYSRKEAAYRLVHYRKVMFVREPYERLLSAYLSKFNRSHEMANVYGRSIIQNYRKNASKESLATGTDVTFVEFLKFVLGSTHGHDDHHWASYVHSCNPCGVKYDYIGKYETTDADVEYIKRKLNIPELTMPERSIRYRFAPTKNLVAQAYKDVPADVIRGIQEHFKMDFKLFDYPSDLNLSTKTT